MLDTVGKGGDIAGNAIHGGRSTDQFVAGTLNTVATANSFDIANTGGIEDPNMDRNSRGHILVP
jgi:hypothetical protein